MIRTGLLLQPWVPGGVREHGSSLCWWRNLGVWRISPLSSSERAPDGVVRPRLCSFLPQLHPQCPSQAQFWSLHGCSAPPIPATCCKDVGSKGSRFKSYCIFLRSVTLDSQCSLSLSLRGIVLCKWGNSAYHTGALCSHQWYDFPLHPATWLREVAAWQILFFFLLPLT